jgi:hypothetical protein
MKAYFRSVSGQVQGGDVASEQPKKAGPSSAWSRLVAVAVTMYQTLLAAQQENFDRRSTVVESAKGSIQFGASELVLFNVGPHKYGTGSRSDRVTLRHTQPPHS